MSRLTLRRKGAIRAAVISAAGLLGAAVPMSAFGSTGLTISLQTTVGAAGAGGGTVFVVPGSATTVYVYGTVTGTGSTTASDFNGLQYLYYNINATAASNNATTLGGIVSAPALNANFNGGASIGDPGSGYGDQAGVPSGTTTPGIVLGSASAVTSMAKPRAGAPVWANPAGIAADPNDIYTSGAGTSFLLETLTYTSTATPSSLAHVLQSNLSAAIPTVTPYVGANWFQDASTTVTPSAAIQNGAYTAGTGVTITNALAGDANLNGSVTSTDLLTVLQNFGSSSQLWSKGNFVGSPTIGSTDLLTVLQNFGGTLGTGPLVADSAFFNDPQAVALAQQFGLDVVSSVPEPASLGMLALVGLASLRRRRRS